MEYVVVLTLINAINTAVALLFPVIGSMLFFMWRKDKPGRSRLVSRATVSGLLCGGG